MRLTSGRDTSMIYFYMEHGEESLKLVLEKINIIHPTIKFTADWSYNSVNERWKDYCRSVYKTYRHLSILRLFIMPPISLQKKYPYSQALRLNRICSNNAFFDQRCNELEHWLHERGYSERVARQEILKAQKIPRN